MSGRFHEGDDMLLQNHITGAWELCAHLLGQRRGGVSYLLFFPDTERIYRKKMVSPPQEENI